MKQIPISKDTNQNWNSLLLLVKEILTEDYNNNPHIQMLLGLEADCWYLEKQLLGLKRAPAATGNHHAFEGGLVAHLLEMWNLWDLLRPICLAEPYISDERVLKAILYHDLHKGHKTYLLESLDPWKTSYHNGPDDMLMGSDVKTIHILATWGITPDYQQMNALINAEGGYSKIKTKWVSALAKLCYTLDELSGNVQSRIKDRTFLDLRTAESF